MSSLTIDIDLAEKKPDQAGKPNNEWLAHHAKKAGYHSGEATRLRLFDPHHPMASLHENAAKMHKVAAAAHQAGHADAMAKSKVAKAASNACAVPALPRDPRASQVVSGTNGLATGDASTREAGLAMLAKHKEHLSASKKSKNPDQAAHHRNASGNYWHAYQSHMQGLPDRAASYEDLGAKSAKLAAGLNKDADTSGIVLTARPHYLENHRVVSKTSGKDVKAQRFDVHYNGKHLGKIETTTRAGSHLPNSSGKRFPNGTASLRWQHDPIPRGHYAPVDSATKSEAVRKLLQHHGIKEHGKYAAPGLFKDAAPCGCTGDAKTPTAPVHLQDDPHPQFPDRGYIARATARNSIHETKMHATRHEAVVEALKAKPKAHSVSVSNAFKGRPTHSDIRFYNPRDFGV